MHEYRKAHLPIETPCFKGFRRLSLFKCWAIIKRSTIQVIDMYLTHFNLEADPFALNPTKTHEFWSDQREEALKVALKATRSGLGPIVITGPSGMGKTFLANRVRETYSSMTWVRLVATHLNRAQFIQSIAKSVGMQCYDSESPITQQRRLFSHLLSMTRTHGPVLVEIEETHRFDPDLLLEIANLAKWNIHGQTLITFVLVGQERLAHLLSLPPLAHLKAQLSAHIRFEPLNVTEIYQYVSHRVFASSGDPAIFHQSAILALQEYTGGVLFRINTLAKASLIEAALDQETSITESTVIKAATKLGMIRFQAQTHSPPGKLRNFLDRLLRVNGSSHLDVIDSETIWKATDPSLDMARLNAGRKERI